MNEYDLLNKGRELAYSSLQNFLNNLDLNVDAFSHLFSIDIKIDDSLIHTSDNCAVYYPNDNIIYISLSYIKSVIKNNKSEENIISNIAITLVHEILHANHDIIINNGINYNNLKDVISNNIGCYYASKEYDIDEFISLTIQNSNYVDQLYPYIPVKVNYYKNHTYSLVFYDVRDEKFLIFPKQFFKTNMKKSYNINKLCNEIDNKRYKFKCDIVDYSFKINNCLSNTMDTIDKDDIDYYHTLKEARKFINKQVSFEEVMIESLANIIVLSNEKELDLDYYTDYIINTSKYTDKVLSSKIWKYGGLNLIKWFITSAYQDEYTNEFKKIFFESYYELINNFDSIYNSINNFEACDKSSINKIDKIIDLKLKK